VVDFMKSIRWHAWAVMSVDLAAGWISRGALQSELPATSEGTDAPRITKGRSPGARLERPLRSSPTAVFLKETEGISASRCEELFREICAEKESRDAIRLQAVFRRWMELEDPEDLLVRLAAVKEIERGIWSGPFFEAWAAIDYKGAVAGTAKTASFPESGRWSPCVGANPLF
jgi:hypothetical protein